MQSYMYSTAKMECWIMQYEEDIPVLPQDFVNATVQNAWFVNDYFFFLC